MSEIGLISAILAVSLAVCFVFFILGRMSQSQKMCSKEVLFLSGIMKELRQEVEVFHEKRKVTPKIEEATVIKRRRRRRKKVEGDIV